jgi:DNA-binding NarL/FixJ family response regulator
VKARVYVISCRNQHLRLTNHLVEILRQVATGKKAAAIASAMGTSVETVYEQIQEMKQHFGAHTTPELVRLAILHGFVDPSVS